MASIENMTDEELLAMNMPGERGYVMPDLRDPLLQQRVDSIDSDDILMGSMNSDPVYKIGEPDIEDGFVDRVVRGAERVGRGAKGLATGLGDLAYGAFAAKQKAIMDPAGAVEEAKQFASRVMEGDPEAQQQALIATSTSMVEPAATGADVELARRDIRKARETRDPGDIATAGISTVFAAIPIVGVGLTKSITKAAPDAPEPVFESVLEKAAVDKIQKKTGVDAIIPTLRSGGATKSEIADTKVPEFVEQAKAEGKKSVTKDELIKHLDENKVQIEEVRLGGRSATGQSKEYQVATERLNQAHADLESEFKQLQENMMASRLPIEGVDTYHRMIEYPKNIFEALDNRIEEVGRIVHRSSEQILFQYLGQPNVTGIRRANLTDADIEVRPDLDIQPSDADLLDDIFDFTYEANTLGVHPDLGTDLFNPEFVEDIGSQLKDMAKRYATGKGSDTPLQQKFVRDINQLAFEFSQMQKPGGILDHRKQILNFTKTPEFKNLEKQFTEQYELGLGLRGRNQPVHGAVTLPGGTNYQEILLTVPQKVSEDFRSWHKSMLDRTMGPHSGTGPDPMSYDLLPAEQQKAARAQYRNEKDKEAFVSPGFTESHHGDIPNVLAHIRTKDRIDHKGRKILFIEEIQSDWHQKGRNRGYSPEENDLIIRNLNQQLVKLKDKEFEYDQIIDKYYDSKEYLLPNQPGAAAARESMEATSADAQVVRQKIRKLRSQLEISRQGPVPNAPLKDTKEWTALAIRRIFREAADGGYDGVAFTRGKDIQRVSGGEIEGQEYFYDKLVPSIAKKESKAPLEKGIFPKLSGTQRFERFFHTPDGVDIEPFEEDITGAVYNMFLLTPKVKEKVSKPQKLYEAVIGAGAGGAAARSMREDEAEDDG